VIATVRFGAYGSFFASARATVRVHSHRDVASRRRIATRDGDDATRCDMARNEGNRDEAR
jgi:hypothetical protein